MVSETRLDANAGLGERKCCGGVPYIVTLVMFGNKDVD